MKVLGINAFGHDTSAVLVVDGHIISAISEERVSRKKHDRTFPCLSVNYLLKRQNLKIDDIDAIGINMEINFYINEFHFKNNYPIAQESKQMDRIQPLLNLRQIIRDKLQFSGPIIEHYHHYCHLRATQYQSRFDEAILFSFDGIGEINSSSSAVFENGKIHSYEEYDKFPNSLGLVYSALTYFLGWLHHCDEGIVMGLAPYGDQNKKVLGQEKSYKEFFNEIIKLDDQLQACLDLEYFDFQNKRDTWVSEKFRKIFGPKRNSEDEITDHHKNLAAALQNRVEEIIFEKIKEKFTKYPNFKALCLSGGVALNCSNNGKLLNSGLIENIFVQPASGDDGCAIGAALLTHDICSEGKLSKLPSSKSAAYLGPKYTDAEVQNALNKLSIPFNKCSSIPDKVSNYLLENKIVAWYKGSSEFGPRALGHRSIIAKPFPGSNKNYINNKIKFREEFRPFAPIVLEDEAQKYFELKKPSPHMLYAIKANSLGLTKCPAVVHIDGTARIQTVTKEQNQEIFDLLTKFYEFSGIPVLLNTSFNVKGQPIVETPDEAVKTFLDTAIDCLVIEEYVLIKEKGQIFSVY